MGKVVGSAGTQEKVDFLRGIGVTAFNYKDEGRTMQQQLDEACPDGIDIYFENVGGETLEVVLENMNNFGRIIACGMISQYDMPFEERYGVKNLFYIIGKRLKFQGTPLGLPTPTCVYALHVFTAYHDIDHPIIT